MTKIYEDEVIYAVQIINKIYAKEGFQGVMDFVKGELEYGNVTKQHGLYCITTGGWSDDEFIVHSLTSPVSKLHYHYKGYIVGGAFYFSEDKNSEVEMVRV